MKVIVMQPEQNRFFYATLLAKGRKLSLVVPHGMLEPVCVYVENERIEYALRVCL